jgi:hypothetical protein
MKRTAMHTKRRLAAVIAGCLAASAALLGCELIVDFDRSKIPQGMGDAATIEGGGPDGSDAQVVTDAADGATASDADAASSTPDASDGGGTATGDASDASDASDAVVADADDSG